METQRVTATNQWQSRPYFDTKFHSHQPVTVTTKFLWVEINLKNIVVPYDMVSSERACSIPFHGKSKDTLRMHVL
jgi:hypothetical protein